MVTRRGRQDVVLACRPLRGVLFITCRVSSESLSSMTGRTHGWACVVCPFLLHLESSAAPTWPAAHTCCFSTSSPRPQHHGRPPALALIIPIFPNGLTYLISLLGNHRWLPSTLGTKPNSFAWHYWRPSMLFNHTSQDSALGIVPSNLVDFLPGTLEASGLCWTIPLDTPP